MLSTSTLAISKQPHYTLPSVSFDPKFPALSLSSATKPILMDSTLTSYKLAAIVRSCARVGALATEDGGVFLVGLNGFVGVRHSVTKVSRTGADLSDRCCHYCLRIESGRCLSNTF